MVRRAALGARTLHEAICQKELRVRVVEPLDIALGHEARLAGGGPNLPAQLTVLLAVRAAVVIELDIEAGEVANVGLPHVGDHGLFAAAFLPGPDHDRRAVRVVGADVDAAMAAQLLEPHPDIGLDVLHQVPDVDMPVGIGQGGGDQDATRCHECSP